LHSNALLPRRWHLPALVPVALLLALLTVPGPISAQPPNVAYVDSTPPPKFCRDVDGASDGTPCISSADCQLCVEPAGGGPGPLDPTDGTRCQDDGDCVVTPGFDTCRTPGFLLCGGELGSLANPYTTITAALNDAAVSGYDEIQVAAGEYLENVNMISGVSLIGEGSDVTTIRAVSQEAPAVRANLLASGTRLEGFEITGGGGDNGGGVQVITGGPIIAHNLITGNTVVPLDTPEVNPGKGGGIYVYGSYALITDNIITGNTAGRPTGDPEGASGGMGGGIFIYNSSSATISRNVISCNTAHRFDDNYSTYLFGYGGGMEVQLGLPRITDNLIAGNVSGLGGAGLDVYLSSPVVVNNTLHGNHAVLPSGAPPAFSYGGGLAIAYSLAPAVFNNLITANSAVDGGGGMWIFPVPAPESFALMFEHNDVFSNTDSSPGDGNDDYANFGMCSDDSENNAGLVCATDDDCRDTGAGTCFFEDELTANPVGDNLSADPEYAGGPGLGALDCESFPPVEDFALGTASAAVDAGTEALRTFTEGPDGELGTPDDTLAAIDSVSGVDLLFEERVVDGNADGQAIPDMGALELQPGPPGDLDGDGVPDDGDASGSTEDAPCPDGVSANCDDNCIAAFNNTPPDGVQIDADGDGAGDACDLCPAVADPEQRDTDRDGLGDACDPDLDNDAVLEDGGSAPCADGETEMCDDNCPTLYNPGQDDSDDDGLGDSCDCDPSDPLVAQGLPEPVGDTLRFAAGQSTVLEWEAAEGADRYYAYRGDMAELQQTWIYTQDPETVALADRFCDDANAGEPITTTSFEDPFEPGGEGEIVYYLVTGVADACQEGLRESSLGQTGGGRIRINTNRCPPIGACCATDSSCSEVTADQCATAEGSYQGDGSRCDPEICL
jgi:hypothetical protein